MCENGNSQQKLLLYVEFQFPIEISKRNSKNVNLEY